MIYHLPYRRMLILTEGRLGTFTSKTGVSVMRYRRGDVLGVLDAVHAGRRIGELVEAVADVPIFARVADALEYRPDAILIGVAPVGGALPESMRRHLVDGLTNGLSIVSGLHVSLNDDTELANLARQSGARIHDLRIPGPIERVATAKARDMSVKRVLTVGTSTNVGKMLTALELRRAAAEAGLDAAFVATGQTGIMIEGWGIAIDHVLSDFTAGAVELMLEHVADRRICFVEGQGSIDHPGYSGVTLSLMHGCCPDAMVIVHRPGRHLHNELPGCTVTPIGQQIVLYEQAMAPVYPSKVVAVAVNTVGMSAEEAKQSTQAVADETGLPSADPIRDGCGVLWTAVRQYVGI